MFPVPPLARRNDARRTIDLAANDADCLGGIFRRQKRLPDLFDAFRRLRACYPRQRLFENPEPARARSRAPAVLESPDSGALGWGLLGGHLVIRFEDRFEALEIAVER